MTPHAVMDMLAFGLLTAVRPEGETAETRKNGTPTYAFTHCIWRALADAVAQRSAGSGVNSSSWVFVSHPAQSIQDAGVLDARSAKNGAGTVGDSNVCMRAPTCTKAIGWLTAAVCETVTFELIDEPACAACGHIAQISLEKSR